MRVLVEASSAFDQYAGIGRYARNVIGTMIQSAPPDVAFRMLRTRDRAELDISEFEQKTSHIPIRVLPLSRRNAYRLWFRLKLPLDVQWLSGRADVAYSPDFTLWHTSGIRRMVTVHDLVYLTHPEHTVPGLLNFLERVVVPQIEEATKVAVVSRATENELVRLIGVPRRDIVYAPNAVDSRFHLPAPYSSDELEKLGFPKEFSLMVGTIEPRKNHINAVRAYSQSEAAKRVPLFIVGRHGWGLEHILPVIHDAEARGVAKYVDFIPDAILPRLLATARMLVFPSWNEGFGLPVAEMLATGGNVVISRAPALLEVAGDHGQSAEAGDIDGLTAAINASMEQPTNETREMRSRWIRSQYDWETTAQSVLQGLRQNEGD